MTDQEQLELLQVLEISPSQLKDLSAAQKNTLIKKQYRQLALRYHPDHHKDPASTARFQCISAAYEALNETVPSTHVPEIYRYFILETVHIPDTAFDYHLRDGIERAYEALMRRFLRLSGDDEKRAFAQRYQPFLALKASLDLKLEHLRSIQAKHFYERQNETLEQKVTREYRELLLRTYGEEFLNDFEYRRALASGKLYPILATRKLISPIKAISFVLDALLITAYFLFKQSTKNLASVMADKNIGLFILKLSATLSLFILTVYGICYFLPFPLLASLLTLPLLSRTLSVIASPVNELFRPLAKYLSTYPAVFTALCLVGLPAIGYLLLSINAFANVLALLPYLTFTLNICTLIGTVKFLYDIFALYPNDRFKIGVFVVISLLVGLLIPMPEMSVPVANTLAFFLALTNLSIVYLSIRSLKYLSTNDAEISAPLPLPQEDIPRSLEEAALLGYSNASTQSHRFFNTPIDAECLPLKGRSTWQQTCSFFGVDTLKQQEEPTFHTQQPRTSLLLDACA